MAYTYDPIATITTNSSQASISFTSITSGFTDLILTIEANLSASGSSIYGYLNNDSSTSTTSYATFALGLAHSTSSTPGQFVSPASTNSNGYGVGAWQGFSTERVFGRVYFPQYSNTFSYKQIYSYFGDIGYNLDIVSSLWRSTSAISTIEMHINNPSTTFNSGAKATLWGIKRA
jgi:hypothetical protein